MNKVFIFGIVFLFGLISVNAAWFASCSNSCTPVESGIRCDDWTGVAEYLNGCDSRNNLIQTIRCQGNSVYGDRIYNSPECLPKTEVTPAQPESNKPVISTVCDNRGDLRCENGNQEICENGNWRIWNTCSYGCNNNYCIPGVGQDTGTTIDNTKKLDVSISGDISASKPAPAEPKSPVADIKKPDAQPIKKESISAPAQKINVDFNNNGCSDFDDYLEFAKNFGSKSSKYDFNNNGEVDFTDFVEFAKTYEQTQCDTTRATTVEQIETEIDCNINPLKCYNIKKISDNCDDLKLGEKCEVSWEVEINKKSAVNSEIGFNPLFSYETKNKNKKEDRANTVLRILNEITGNRRFPLTSSLIFDLTGGAIFDSGLGLHRVGRFECSLKPNSGICCPSPFFKVSEQDSSLCVRAGGDESRLTKTSWVKQDVLKQIGEKMQKYLNSKDSKERKDLEKELRELDSKLRN
ncbi:hypothetical protein HYT56_05400 [Candidatus Woesearchaeota archaeon]|nr:hypothetical protein [Candidatus Woesearchaeota archaeon]